MDKCTTLFIGMQESRQADREVVHHCDFMREVTYLVDTLPPSHFVVGYTLIMVLALEINWRAQIYRDAVKIFSYWHVYGGTGDIPIIKCQPGKLPLS